MSEVPRIILRQWRPEYGHKILHYVEKWQEYQKFWRRSMVLPNAEECFCYPKWSQNLVMMVEDFLSGEIIGMVVGYSADIRNGIIYAGFMLDTERQGQGYGTAAVLEWVSHLFDREGFRKVAVEMVDDYFIGPLLNLGFLQVGRRIKHMRVGSEWMDELLLECHSEDWKGR